MNNQFRYLVLTLLLAGLSITAQRGICAEFMRGADISIQTRQEADGVVYNEYGVPKDVLTIFKNHDLNWIRIRIFHTPSGSPYGVCQDLAYVTTLGARVKAEGFKFLLDFHYSDTWADPGKQYTPAAWASYNHSQLVTAVHDYTRDVIAHLRTNNAMPDMVQIGNEIINGMLWPDGEIYGSGSWANFVDLINAGIAGVNDGRGTEPMPKIMIHIDRGGDWGSTEWFFDNLLSRGVVFDVIGQSFYPEWHGTLDDLEYCLNNTAARYPHDIVVAEAGDYYTGSGATPESQKAYLEGVIQRVEAIPNGKGIGVFYWEPTWVWSSGVAYRALFQPISGNWRNVNMLMAMEAFDNSDDTTPPEAPTGLSATAGNSVVSLDWTDNTEVDLAGYNVYRSITSGGGYIKLNGSLVAGSNYTDNSVSGGTTYYYVVTAVDTSSNESDGSSEASATPSGSTSLYNFVGINNADTNYNAYAYDVDVFPFAGLATNRNTGLEATDTQYINISTNDTTEWVTLDPGSSDEIFLWVEMKINELPATISRIDLTFNGYTGGSSATPHRIFVLTADANWTLDASWTQVGSDQSISPGAYATMTRSLTSDISNYIDANGKITWAVYETTPSEAMHVNYLETAVHTIVIDYAPAAPAELSATAGFESVSLNWNDNAESDLAGYNVYRSVTSGSDYSKLNVSLVIESNYIDSNVTNGISYYYVVTAVDTNDNESGYSNEASATPADYETCAEVQAGGFGLFSDLNADCYVDYPDLENIAYYWLETDCGSFGNCEGADFVPMDGVVDFFDFGDFALQWLWCNDPQNPDCTPNW